MLPHNAAIGIAKLRSRNPFLMTSTYVTTQNSVPTPETTVNIVGAGTPNSSNGPNSVRITAPPHSHDNQSGRTIAEPDGPATGIRRAAARCTDRPFGVLRHGSRSPDSGPRTRLAGS